MHIREATADDTVVIHDIGCRSYRLNFTTIWSEQGLEAHLEKGFTQAQIRESLIDTNNIWFLISLNPTAAPFGFANLILNNPIPN